MKKKFNIAQIIYDIDEIGGAERIAIDLANQLSETQNSYLINLSPKNRNFSKNNYNFTLLNFRSLFGIKLFDVISFLNLIKTNNIKILHSHNFKPLVFSIIAYFFLKDLKIIYHDHDSIGHSEFPVWNFIFKSLGKRVVSKWICVSDQVKILAAKFASNDKLEVISNSVDLKNFYFNVNYQPDSIIKLVLIANYRPEKNHEILINLFKERCINNIQIDCFGLYLNEDYGLKINKMLQENNLDSIIKLRGPSNDISNLLNHYDIGLLVSLYEGLPMTMLEYMSKGLPVLVPDVGKCKEIVVKANCGIIFNNNDINSLRQKLIEICELRKNWDDWRRNGRRYIEKFHSLDTFTNRMMKIYKD